MLTDTAEYQYQLENAFFLDLDAPEVQKGQVNVTLKVRKTSGVYQLDFQTEGKVIVICDRCLDEMEQPIETTKIQYPCSGIGTTHCSSKRRRGR